MVSHFSERTVEIVRMRQNGETYSAIGRHFGISLERARQIYEKEQRLLSRAKRIAELPRSLPDDFPLEKLTGVISWELIHFGKCKTVGEVRRASDDELLRVQGFGRKALHALRTFIERHSNG